MFPGVFVAGLFLLPFLDRRHERHPLKRPLATAALVLILLGPGGLILLAKHQDRTNPEYNAKLKHQEELARGFLKSPFQPQEVGDPQARRPATTAAALGTMSEPPKEFLATCALCHGDHAEGNDLGPPLLGVTSKPNRTREHYEDSR